MNPRLLSFPARPTSGLPPLNGYNICQVLVSADPRYGPLYNLGVARVVARSLLEKGYVASQGRPVVLLAYSGGVQIAVGIAPYLKKNLGASVRVVGVGGVLTGDPGIQAVDQMLQIQSCTDRIIPALGLLLSAGRWPTLPHSPWNRFRRQGRYRVVDPGPMRHTGRGDYFSRRPLPDGRPQAAATLALVVEELRQSDPAD